MNCTGVKMINFMLRVFYPHFLKKSPYCTAISAALAHARFWSLRSSRAGEGVLAQDKRSRPWEGQHCRGAQSQEVRHFHKAGGSATTAAANVNKACEDGAGEGRGTHFSVSRRSEEAEPSNRACCWTATTGKIPHTFQFCDEKRTDQQWLRLTWHPRGLSTLKYSDFRMLKPLQETHDLDRKSQD